MPLSTNAPQREPWVVLYRLPAADPPLAEPRTHACFAESYDDAESYFEEAFPNAAILWIFQGNGPAAALAEYYADITAHCEAIAA